jgi:hypothetical protein
VSIEKSAPSAKSVKGSLAGRPEGDFSAGSRLVAAAIKYPNVRVGRHTRQVGAIWSYPHCDDSYCLILLYLIIAHNSSSCSPKSLNRPETWAGNVGEAWRPQEAPAFTVKQANFACG